MDLLIVPSRWMKGWIFTGSPAITLAWKWMANLRGHSVMELPWDSHDEWDFIVMQLPGHHPHSCKCISAHVCSKPTSLVLQDGLWWNVTWSVFIALPGWLDACSHLPRKSWHKSIPWLIAYSLKSSVCPGTTYSVMFLLPLWGFLGQIRCIILICHSALGIIQFSISHCFACLQVWSFTCLNTLTAHPCLPLSRVVATQ